MDRLFFISLIVSASFLFSCSSQQSTDSKTDEKSAEQTAQIAKETSFYGTYEGTLPCADCSGIKTNLTLRDDSTYDLIEEYLEKSNGPERRSGVYEVDNDIIKLIAPSSGHKTYYKILDNKIALVDESGDLATGELADHYILNKIEQ